jgi:enamine deaminase RidA (YjgF/YER057c/UK114 family)
MSEIQRLNPSRRFSKAVIHSGIVYLSGQVADTVGVPFRQQLLEVLANISELLSRSGSSANKILVATIYLADIRYYEELNAVWDEWTVNGQAPARTTLEARLAAPGYLVEVTIIAAQ